MEQASKPSIVLEVAVVKRHTVTLEALDARDGLILLGPNDEPASITLPNTGMLADARPGDRFRLVREDDAS